MEIKIRRIVVMVIVMVMVRVKVKVSVSVECGRSKDQKSWKDQRIVIIELAERLNLL